MLRVKLVCHAGCTAAQGGTLTKKLPGAMHLCDKLSELYIIEACAVPGQLLAASYPGIAVIAQLAT